MSKGSERLLRQSDVRIWLSMLGGIVVWALHLMIVYPLTSLTCRWGWFTSDIAGMSGLHFVQTVVTVIAALFMIGLIYLSLQVWRVYGNNEGSILQQAVAARRPLLAFVATLLNSLFLLAILMSFVPVFVIEPCA